MKLVFDLSVFYDNNNNIVHIQNVNELVEFAGYLAENGHKPIDVDVYYKEAEYGDLALRLYKNNATNRLSWVWGRLSAYSGNRYSIHKLCDLRQRVVDFGDFSPGEINFESLFFVSGDI